jgi:hypothetical protein
MEISFEILEIVSIWIIWENIFDILEEIFLMIGEEYESFIDDRLDDMTLDDNQ